VAFRATLLICAIPGHIQWREVRLFKDRDRLSHRLGFIHAAGVTD